MAERKLRILCFGDSLTAGYAEFGSIYHPYNEKLAQKLEEALPGVKVEIKEDGKPGDITSRFLSRMQKDFATSSGSKPGSQPFDWTIVLGGTNDLAYNFRPEHIFESLERTWSLALARGSKVLALTVPEAGTRGKQARERLDTRRNRLNTLIKGYTRKNFYTFDFHAALPYFALSQEDNCRYWDDGIHLTPAGYDLMGEKIASALLEILDREEAAAIPGQVGGGEAWARGNGEAPRKKKRVFRDDENVFLEEDGDPTLLDQGYIVVRRKDLD